MGTSFVAPPGLTQSYLGTDGLVLSGAQTASQGSCAIILLPPRAAEADAMAQAINTVKAFIAPDFNDVIAPWGGYSQPIDSSYISRGVASARSDYPISGVTSRTVPSRAPPGRKCGSFSPSWGPR